MGNNFALGTVETALSPQERFEEYLQSRGKRVTQQRRWVVDEVFSRHEHFNADELCDQLQRAGRKVSRPTVYRTVKELVEAGLIREIETLSGRRVYEHDYGYPQHDHLYCEKCERLIEFHSEDVSRIRDAVAREQQFRATGHRLIIFGICAECSRTRRRVRKLELV